MNADPILVRRSEIKTPWELSHNVRKRADNGKFLPTGRHKRRGTTYEEDFVVKFVEAREEKMIASHAAVPIQQVTTLEELGLDFSDCAAHCYSEDDHQATQEYWAFRGIAR